MRVRAQGDHDHCNQNEVAARPLAANAWGAIAVFVLSASLVTACSGGDDSSDGSAQAGTDAPVPEASTDASEESDSEPEDVTGDADSAGSASATVEWAGETYDLDTVTCTDEPLLAEFQMLARGTDAPTLAIVIGYDGLSDNPDMSEVNRVEIFFPGGSTVGEGEGYVARYDEITGVTASADGASGSLHLGPDDSTMATEVNPEGGQLDFEVSCG